jgi:hypothetical protein
VGGASKLKEYKGSPCISYISRAIFGLVQELPLYWPIKVRLGINYIGSRLFIFSLELF